MVKVQEAVVVFYQEKSAWVHKTLGMTGYVTVNPAKAATCKAQ